MEMYIIKYKILVIFLVFLLTMPIVSSSVFAANSDGKKLKIEGSQIETSMFYGKYLHDLNNITLIHGKVLYIAPILHINGRNKGYRKIYMRFEDSNGNILFQNYAYTNLLAIFKFRIDTKKLTKGKYKITFWYNGNKRDHFPPLNRVINVRLV